MDGFHVCCSTPTKDQFPALFAARLKALREKRAKLIAEIIAG